MPRLIPSHSRIDCDKVLFWMLAVALVVFIVCSVFAMTNTYGCPQCGHVAHPTDAYCAQCGKQLRITK